MTLRDLLVIVQGQERDEALILRAHPTGLLQGTLPWQSHEAAAWPLYPSSETLHGPGLLRIVPSE